MSSNLFSALLTAGVHPLRLSSSLCRAQGLLLHILKVRHPHIGTEWVSFASEEERSALCSICRVTHLQSATLSKPTSVLAWALLYLSNCLAPVLGSHLSIGRCLTQKLLWALMSKQWIHGDSIQTYDVEKIPLDKVRPVAFKPGLKQIVSFRYDTDWLGFSGLRSQSWLALLDVAASTNLQIHCANMVVASYLFNIHSFSYILFGQRVILDASGIWLVIILDKIHPCQLLPVDESFLSPWLKALLGRS